MNRFVKKSTGEVFESAEDIPARELVVLAPTGFKDEKGQKAFEGDVVSAGENRLGILYFVFDTKSWHIWTLPLESVQENKMRLTQDLKFKILGNRFERKWKALFGE